MTRRRTPRQSSRGQRRTARMPLWAVVVFLMIAAVVALDRSAGLGFFGAPPTATAPVLSTAVIATAAPDTPSALAVDVSTAPTVPATMPASATARPTTAAPANTLPADVLPADAQSAQVVRIVDGDTIEVEINGRQERVRYLGMDTPERQQPGYLAATNANRALVEDQLLYLVPERTNTDVFDRLLRHLYLADGTHVNATLIAEGWAQPVEYPPDIQYAQAFTTLALEAADARRGFWSGGAPEDGAMPYGLTVREVAIRRAPDEQSPVNTTVPPRTPLTIYGRTAAGDWLEVRPPSRNGGWLPATAVDVRVALDEIPVVE